MKILPLALAVCLFLISSVSLAEKGPRLEYSLHELLNSFAKTSNTEFMVDSSVKGKATISGITDEELVPEILASILSVHGYSTIEKSGKVHVVPEAMAESLIQQGGVHWVNQ